MLPSHITNVDQLINYLIEMDEKYELILKKKEIIKISVNKTYSSFDAKISNNDEIAFFPPVTGGWMRKNSPMIKIKIQNEDFDVSEETKVLLQNNTGAIVNFIGVVRGYDEKNNQIINS